MDIWLMGRLDAEFNQEIEMQNEATCKQQSVTSH